MADAILRALLENSVSRHELAAEVRSLGRLLPQAARQGVVTVRLAELLRLAGVDVPRELADAAAMEKIRISESLDLMGRISAICRRRGERFVFTKAFQHLPDMGHDVDLLTEGSAIDCDFAAELGAVSESGSLSNAVAGKRSYSIPGAGSPLEVHGGRLGQVGEHVELARLVLDRGTDRAVGPLILRGPSREDGLLIQVVQRMYCHFSLRLSDIVHARNLLTGEELDWNRIEKDARQAGILEGVRTHLSILRSILRGVGVEFRAPNQVIGPAPAAFQQEGLNFILSRWSIGGRLYARKLAQDLARSDAESAGRLMMLPVIAAVSIGRDILRRTQI